MFRRLVLLGGVVAIGLAFSGCTRCGPIWDDWMQSPKSCKSDHL
ncbi:peptidylprolyl isomerase [Bradyrhizobium pachyrhizi]|uniref:Peptidylprolyl isomerase n=1 Tax=Bradyrhizobium pachyrhizi TaxID=280333 RepID=A0A844SQU1_9BRAD|nr:peptidylprolyl isomerase [Bradyrhizobium pachyrhizi]MVT65742.1 peptidylprolyl isomerase [Bradyrhizobium pachyrhizi]